MSIKIDNFYLHCSNFSLNDLAMISCMKLLKDTTFDKCTTLKLFGIPSKLIQVCQKALNDKTTKNTNHF
uniref:Uncharacterized protein n=1 Tax=Megaselia scalaris TaxID=36166 RepID=T1GUE9_MEGSC